MAPHEFADYIIEPANRESNQRCARVAKNRAHTTHSIYPNLNVEELERKGQLL